MAFTTNSTGKGNDTFSTGAQRDSQDGKRRYDLIPKSMLDIDADFMEVMHHKGLDILDTFEHIPPTPEESEVEPRYDLIPDVMLRRLGELYARGAIKYGENNYQKGIPVRRIFASLWRHLVAAQFGLDPEEDHLAAIIWNATAIMFMVDGVHNGTLPSELLTDE